MSMVKYIVMGIQHRITPEIQHGIETFHGNLVEDLGKAGLALETIDNRICTEKKCGRFALSLENDEKLMWHIMQEQWFPDNIPYEKSILKLKLHVPDDYCSRSDYLTVDRTQLKFWQLQEGVTDTDPDVFRKQYSKRTHEVSSIFGKPFTQSVRSFELTAADLTTNYFDKEEEFLIPPARKITLYPEGTVTERIPAENTLLTFQSSLYTYNPSSQKWELDLPTAVAS